MMWPDHNEIPLHTNLFGRKLNLFLSFFAWANGRAVCTVHSATVVIHETGDFDIGIKISNIGLRALIAHDSYRRLATGNLTIPLFLHLSRVRCAAPITKFTALNRLIIVIYLNVWSVCGPLEQQPENKKKKQRDISRAISWKSMKILGKWWSRFKSRNLWSPIRRGVFDQHIENAHIFPARKMR